MKLVSNDAYSFMCLEQPLSKYQSLFLASTFLAKQITLWYPPH